MHCLPIGLAAVLTVLPVAAQAGEREDILASAHAAFAPYMDEQDMAGPDWELQLYSRETTMLIAEWEKGVSHDEVEDLNGFSWFCQCQDFDPARFKVALETRHQDGEATASVEAQVNLGWDATSQKSRLAMVKENGRWLVDDLFSRSFPNGLKADLRKAIAEHGKAR